MLYARIGIYSGCPESVHLILMARWNRQRHQGSSGAQALSLLQARILTGGSAGCTNMIGIKMIGFTWAPESNAFLAYISKINMTC